MFDELDDLGERIGPFTFSCDPEQEELHLKWRLVAHRYEITLTAACLNSLIALAFHIGDEDLEKEVLDTTHSDYMNEYCDIALTSSLGDRTEHRVTRATYFNLVNSNNNVELLNAPDDDSYECAACEDPWD